MQIWYQPSQVLPMLETGPAGQVWLDISVCACHV